MASAKILGGEILAAAGEIDRAVTAALAAREPPVSALAAMLACQRIAARCAIDCGVSVEQCSVKQVEAYFAEEQGAPAPQDSPQAAASADPKENLQ